MSGTAAAPILTRYETIELPISSAQTAKVVRAMSEALAVLSDRIAGTVYLERHAIVRR